MTLHRRTYVLLVLAVIISSLATHVFRPRGEALSPCGIRTIALAVEVCPPSDVKGILGDDGSAVREQLHDQTLVDSALIVSYVGLWGTLSLARTLWLAGMRVRAGTADIVETLSILQELALPDPVRFVRWAALAKWSLLGL